MSYHYDVSAKERRAAALLREKGWNVTEPQCPECHGWGTVQRFETIGSGRFNTSVITGEACPNGCVIPALYYTLNSKVVSYTTEQVPA